jgi:exopolysaccharide production protein ExoQ
MALDKDTGVVSVHRDARAQIQIRRWALIVVFLFLATHGVFSFQQSASASGAFLHAKVSEPRQHGILGYVILPGFAYSIILLLVLSRFRNIITCALHFKMLTFIAVLAMCSAMWSQDPPRSALYSLFYSLGTLFAYYLAVFFETEELMRLLMYTGLTLCVLGLAVIVFFPRFGISAGDDQARAGAWIGIFMDRVSAAKCLVFLLTPGIIRIAQKFTARRLAYVSLMLLMIVRAKAVTAIIALLVYCGFVYLLRICRKVGPRASIGLLLTLASIGVVCAIAGPQALQAVLGAFGRDTTLSGRTDVWAAVMRSIEKRPLLGYGYYAFWQGLKGESANVIQSINWSFGYAHDEVLEIWLQLGLVGVVCVAITFLQAIKNAWFCFRHDQSGHYDWYISLVVLTLIYNFDEETILFPNELLSILYVVMCCGLAIAVLQIRKDIKTRCDAQYANDLSLAG